jgi:hypothetical protein
VEDHDDERKLDDENWIHTCRQSLACRN